MRHRAPAIVALACALASHASVADAAAYASLAPASTGTIAFNITSMNDSALPGSQVYAFDLNVLTLTANGGTVALTGPTLIGTAGAPIDPGAIRATCAITSGAALLSSYTASSVRLAATPVTCLTLTTASIVSIALVTFTVSLTLDDTQTGGHLAFPADTYAPTAMTVTATAQ